MKFTKISVAAALACTAIAGHATMATGAAQATLDDANLNGRIIYVSGASAMQKGFDGVVAGLFDTTKTITYYTDNSSGSNNGNGTKANFVAVAGQLAAKIGTWAAGTNVIIQYRTLGGSGFGVFPVATGQAIPFATITTASCTQTGTNSLTTAAICAGTTNQVPDAGVSDVDPSFGAFDSTYNTPGGDTLTSTAYANLTATQVAALGTPIHLYGLAFGIAVTNNVAPTVAFSKTLMSAILAGTVGTWDQVDASLPADDIVICRRTPGSGTQVIANNAFGGYPCVTSHTVAVPADRASNPFWTLNSDGTQTYAIGANQGQVIVIENDTSGDLKNCLGAAATGGSYTTHNRDGDLTKAVTVTFTGIHKAIGLLSLDSLSAGSTATTGSAAWSFRALGGAGQITQVGSAAPVVTAGSTGMLPTQADVLSGNYDMVSEETMLIPVRTVGEKNTILNQLATNAQNAVKLYNVPALQYVAGVFPTAAGAVATPNGTATNGNTLRVSFQGGDICSPLQRNN